MSFRGAFLRSEYLSRTYEGDPYAPGERNADEGPEQCGLRVHAWKPDVDFDAYQKSGGYSLLKDCLSDKRTRDELIKIVSDAGLRGLGGAGFPTGRKWALVRAEPAPRMFAVNADEGEPGTFKDRYYLERDPHRFLEGALIAAWAVGIDSIYIYLRDEYHGRGWGDSLFDLADAGACWTVRQCCSLKRQRVDGVLQ